MTDAIKESNEIVPVEELPVKKRSCTDCLFFILILVAWIMMNVIGLAATGNIYVKGIHKGDPKVLIHGVDYEGNICGVNDPVKHLKKRIMPNFYGTNPTNNGVLVPILFAVCVSDCPNQGETIVDPYGNYEDWEAQYDTMNFVNNCIYDNEKHDTTSATTIMSDFIHTAGPIAIFGLFVSFGLCILFLLLTKIPGLLNATVWFSIVSVFLMLIIGCCLLLTKAHQERHKSQGSRERNLLRALGIILAICSGIWIVFIFIIRKRLELAIKIIRESARAMIQIPFLYFLPLIKIVIFAGFTALWMYYCFYLVSSGDIITHYDDTTGLSYKTMSYNQYTRHAIIFMLFAWLWSVGFLDDIGHICSAHLVLTWFFQGAAQKISFHDVCSSSYLAVRYHSGTAAFGSLIITIIRMIRLFVEYLRYQTRHNRDPVSQYIINCLAGCLAFIQRIIQYFNKHLYIQCAMHGTSFLPSGINAFQLLSQHLGQFAAVSVVGEAVVMIGKILVSLLCALIGYLYISTYMDDQVNGYVLPTVFIGFLAYCTSTMILSVLIETSDALTQACIEREITDPGHFHDHTNELRKIIIDEKDVWLQLNVNDSEENIPSNDPNLSSDANNNNSNDLEMNGEHNYDVIVDSGPSYTSI